MRASSVCRLWMLLALSLLLAACGVIPGTEQRPLVWMSLSYEGGGTDLTARYSLPPPPGGTTYVAWAVTQDGRNTAKIGVIPRGNGEGSLTARVSFRVDGVLISAEDNPDTGRIGENRGVVDVGIKR